tara:strand:+ start:319 stop:735 length:417 start_codon:yes stop_codon:yes gene_type:complete
MILQKEIVLPKFDRGFHIITQYIVDAIIPIKISRGMLHVFIKHTSASISIGENADPTVRVDLERSFNKLIPENAAYYTHTHEGPDDMPAHIKSALLGASITIPISDHKLNLGVWQGIYLCEHRNVPSTRKIVITLLGD